MTRSIYEIGPNGFWTGEARPVEDSDPTPVGWTDRSVPALGAGEAAAWSVADWVVTTTTPQTGAPTPTVDEDARRQLYAEHADPLFFKWQAGEATKADWLAMRASIKAGLIEPDPG